MINKYLWKRRMNECVDGGMVYNISVIDFLGDFTKVWLFPGVIC